MKKNALARALPWLAFAFSGSLFAQSQVTIYGVIDTNLEYINNLPKEGGGSGTAFRMRDSGLQGPRLGFRGSEDLGGGLKAIFTFEHGLNSTNGAQADPARFFNRGAFMGLETQHHRVTLGRQYTSLFDALLFITPLSYSGAYEPFSPLLGGLRNNSAVKYRFNMDGWLAQVHYAFGDQPDSKAANAAWGGYLGYAKNGWNAAIAADQQNGASVNGAYSRARKIAIGASYQFDQTLRLSAGYRWGENKTETGVTALRDDYWWVGANYKVSTPLTLSFGYYQDNVRTRNGTGQQPTMRQLTLQAVYALSKRTSLYAAVSHAKNAGLGMTALSTLGGDAHSQSGVSAGIRHAF